MFCDECGKQINDDALFCPECGSKVVHSGKPNSAEKSSTQCPNCGMTVDKKAEFCPECGTSLNKKKGNAKKLVPVIITLIIIAVIALAVLFVIRLATAGSPEKVTEKYVQALYEADGEQAYKLIPKIILKEECNEVIDLGLVDNKREAKEYIIEEIADYLEGQKETITYDCTDITGYTCEIYETEDYGIQELSELNRSYRRDFGDKFKATEYKKVNYDIIFNTANGKNAKSGSIYVMKINGKWYYDFIATGYFGYY